MKHNELFVGPPEKEILTLSTRNMKLKGCNSENIAAVSDHNGRTCLKKKRKEKKKENEATMRCVKLQFKERGIGFAIPF